MVENVVILHYLSLGEKLFSASENDFEQAINYCSSEHMGTDTIKSIN